MAPSEARSVRIVTRSGECSARKQEKTQSPPTLFAVQARLYCRRISNVVTTARVLAFDSASMALNSMGSQKENSGSEASESGRRVRH